MYTSTHWFLPTSYETISGQDVTFALIRLYRMDLCLLDVMGFVVEAQLKN